METIAIEGNIGSGKTTLLKKTKEKMFRLGMHHVRVIAEPMEAYTNYKGCNPLQLMYENPQKNMFFTQLHIIDSLRNALYDMVRFGRPPVLVTERNLHSTKVFINIGKDEKFLESFEEEKLLEHVDKSIQESPHGPHIVNKLFYIQAPPDICFERIKHRGRIGEESITIDHLELIEQRYHNYIYSMKNVGCKLKIVEWDDEYMVQTLIDFIRHK